MRRAVVVTLVVLATPALATGPVWPVLVGGTPDLDACTTLGRVTGLNPQGDNFLAVREGPGTRYAKLDELHTGDPVYICDEEGGWFGVVYGPPDVDCGVGTPIADRNPYSGPCSTGWVHSRYIEQVAG